MAIELAAFGIGKVADISKDPTKVSEVKSKLEDLKKMADDNQDVQKFIKKEENELHVPNSENQAIGMLKEASDTVKSEDIVKASAQLSSLIKPSATNVFTTFSYPKCSNVH